MLHKTLDDAIATTLEVIEEFGEDYVYGEHYDACYYSVNGQPACLVGHVLAKWGVLPEDVDRKFSGPGTRTGMFAGALLASMRDRGELDVDHLAGVFLRGVQRLQDAKMTWGEAFQGGLKAVYDNEQ